MVTTPWADHEIPLTEAAELGTKKVIAEHCTAGIVVTTDGSVTEFDRADYLEAERRAITDLQATASPSSSSSTPPRRRGARPRPCARA